MAQRGKTKMGEEATTTGSFDTGDLRTRLCGKKAGRELWDDRQLSVRAPDIRRKEDNSRRTRGQEVE